MPDADEDHLRVALIQPGSSRYEQMSGSYFYKIIAIRVEPRGGYVPRLLQGTFWC